MSKRKRVRVKSSHMKSMYYYEDTKILEVEFKNSDVYQYFEVPIEVVQHLYHAKSKGKFMHKNIRNKYKCTKIEDQ